MSDLWDGASSSEWEDHVRQNLIPRLENSAATISLIPRGETDIKFAVELGLSIMLDKPIIALVQPGMSIPNGLAAVAAEIVEVDIAKDPDAAQRSIIEAFSRVVDAGGRHVSLDEDNE